MKKLLAGIFIFFLFACGKSTEEKNLISFLPQKTAVVIQSPNLNVFFEEADKIPFLTNEKMEFLGNTRKNLRFLRQLDSLPTSLLAFSDLEKANFTVTLLSETAPEVNLDSVKDKKVESVKFKNLEIIKYEIEENIFYSTQTTNGIFLGSNSLKNLKNLLKRKTGFKNAQFEKAFKAIDLKKNSVLFHHEQAGKKLESWFLGLKGKITDFGSWSSFDIERRNGTLTLNGLSLWPEKNSLQHIFAETGANIHQISQIVPAGSSAFFSISYQNFEKFKTNLKGQNPKALKDDLSTALLKISSEAGILTMGQNELLVLNSMNLDQTEEILASYTSSAGEFRGIEIFEFENKDIFQNNLQPLLSIKNLRFYAILEDFVVFAENPEELEILIADFRNGNTLYEKPYFKEALDHLSGASNMLIVANTKDLKDLLEENLVAPYKPEVANLEFGNYRIAAFQVTAETGYSHLHGVFLHAEAQENHTKPSQILSIALEAPLLTEPQFVKNHVNNEMDITVQDINNKLYLISNKGEIFWKKQLDGPVLGKMQQVDLLKNNKFQLAFATPKRVEVLDRNGNEVKPFPLKFQDEITQPLSLFDYDSNRNYRFLVTQGRELFMYDRKGNRVRGFGFSKTASEVKFPPKHIRMGNKDYILIAENSGKLNILSRQGKERVRVRETFKFSENEWFQHEGNFISGSASGALISIDAKGGITRKNLSLAENYKIDATPNLLVSLSENVLKIREKEVSLDFGLYTSPEIFLVNNIY